MRKYPIPYAVQGNEDYTPEFWNDFREDVDIRIHVIEEFRELVLGDGYLGGLIKEARDTLQGVLDPAVQTIQKIQEKGFLVARSTTSVTLAEGAELGWIISEGDSRDLFTPSTFTILANTSEPTNYAVLRTISYDRDSGTYFAEVVTFNGSPGPHGGWEIGALAGPTLAMLDYLAQVKGARDAVLTATGPIADYVAAIEADRQEIATLAGQINQNRIDAEEAAQAAQTFDPANYYTKTAADLLLDKKADADATATALASKADAAATTAALTDRDTKAEAAQRVSDAIDAIVFPKSSGVITAVASGAIGNGDVVVLNPDGTVSVVTLTPEGLGPTETFSSENLSWLAGAKINDNTIVLCYRDEGNAGRGRAVIGSISGNQIIFSPPITFLNTGVNFLSVAAIGDNRFVVCYRDEAVSNYGSAMVGQISGASISFGSSAIFRGGGAAIGRNDVAYLGNNRIVVGWVLTNSPYSGECNIGTVSGTEISFPSFKTIRSGQTSNPSVAVIDQDRFVFATRADNSNGLGHVAFCTIAGNTISVVSGLNFDTNSCSYIDVAFVSPDKILIAYVDTSTSPWTGKLFLGKINGSSISSISQIAFDQTNIYSIMLTHDDESDSFIIAYRDGTAGGYTFFVSAAVSGDAVNVSGKIAVASFSTQNSMVTATTRGRLYFHYRNNVSGFGETAFYQMETTDAGNWLGISDADYDDADPADILVAGSVSQAQSGLTIGSVYYIADDGSLTTDSASGRKIGFAISPTDLLITETNP